MVHVVIISALVTVVLSYLTVYGAAQCQSGFVTATCQLRTNPSTVNPPSQITGTVTFRQRVTACCRRLGMLCMHVQVQGLRPNVDGNYGLHVHQSADLSNGCESMGPHFNPLGSNHGGPTDSLDMRHMGDFGNLRLNSRGQVNDTITDYLANLVGQHTIVGRGLVRWFNGDGFRLVSISDRASGGVSVVVNNRAPYKVIPLNTNLQAIALHAMRDDLGLGGVPASLTTGNSGARLACCVIQRTQQ